MEISSLLKEYINHEKVAKLNKLVRQASVKQIYCEGLQASSTPFVFASMLKRQRKTSNVVFILANEEDASYFFHDFRELTDDDETLFFPSSFRRAIKYAQKNKGYEILRTEVLSKLAKSEKAHFIVTYPEALSELVVSENNLNENTIVLKKGEIIDLVELEKELLDKGMKRTNYIYSPGEFAVRGSIIDVFSYTSELPYRIDFFGDEIESIRTFELQSQLSKEQKEEIIIVPELSAQEEKTERISTLADFLPSDTLIVFKEKDYILANIEKTYNEGFSAQAIANNNSKKDLALELEKRNMIIDRPHFEKSFMSFKMIEIGKNHNDPNASTISFETQTQPTYSKNFELISKSFTQFKKEGYKLFIAADSIKQQERLKSIFEDLNCNIEFTPIGSTIHEGFIDHDLQICVFTDHQIFGRYHKFKIQGQRTQKAKVSLAIKDLMMFHQGDYIVHIDHGIGQFAGLVRIPSEKGMQEMIKLIYKNNDIVLVSIHSLYKLSKYKSKDNEAPRISQLGTGAWQKLKSRTKTKVKDIARDLILLYSKRKKKHGYTFSPDNFMQKELEASFVYEDTPDQLKVTQEVKDDMESIQPMDRLICGDVGFGKTEIAVRAAFKAACDNKQVAILVPTTVLTLQHYNTFKNRLHDFPVVIDYLSRARTPKETKEILHRLESGEINIIIGTHKLIGKSVKFKDLGLLIIDEEQKFGVSVKEKLRKLKVNVDTLTLSATPIPRTLQFSLMGARDMSIISTPPPNRHPIETEVHTFNIDIIKEAINFELSRNGQVYFVCNRIAQLPHIAALIHQHIPDARVCIGHGQMPSSELEKIVLNFIDHEYDVLLSTTIIENGIDISNANTIIIDHANNFGLSDLHQMRGRVGRGNKKAFCYLLAPPLSSLSNDAQRRLQAIENFSDLGSGIHIAMHDLDIRGAGNILGGEQSGFIADLGFETYHKILNEAIEELKEEEFADLVENEKIADGKKEQYVSECNIDSDLPIFFHETYIPESSERMLLYRELDNLKNDNDIENYRKRLIDRFGPIPHEGEELISIVKLRRLGIALGIERIFMKQNRLTLYFIENKNSRYYQSEIFTKILQYATSHYLQCKMTEKGGRPRMIIRDVESVGKATQILSSIYNNQEKEVIKSI